MTDRDAIIAFRRQQRAQVLRLDEGRAMATVQWFHTKNVKVSQFTKGK